MPGAIGSVVLKDRDKPNKTVEIQVHHLARPGELSAEARPHNTPPAQTYVVWLEPKGTNRPENIGVLTPDSNLDAQITAMTTQSQFTIFVTAEPTDTQLSPTGQRLLEASVD
ncbi:MAG: hypothetical protein ABSB49_08685 [Polyangia bacterium]